MNLLLHIKEAYGNLVSAKLRSALAVLGILVGTASVVAMVSSGELATAQALAQFKQLGTDLLAITVFDADNSPDSGSNSNPANQLTVAKANGIIKANKKILEVAPYMTTFSPISFEGQSLQGMMIGATQSLQSVIKIKMQSGRFISKLDKYSYFAVIGNKLYKKILHQHLVDPIGQQINLGNTIFTIVGVAAPWQENNFFQADVNSAVIIPIRTVNTISSYAQLNNIVMRLGKAANISAVEKDISAYIDDNVNDKRIFYRSAQEIIASMQAQSRVFTWLLGLIGSISLLVGGIGVMNIMLVSVVERRKEIGIRMAIGARRRDIQKLFLIESVVLSLFGGVLGVLLGVGISAIIAVFAKWAFQLFLFPSLIGFGVSVMIGIFFGFYPAYQASQLDPIETLRM